MCKVKERREKKERKKERKKEQKKERRTKSNFSCLFFSAFVWGSRSLGHF